MKGKGGGSEVDAAEELEIARRELSNRERALAELEAEIGLVQGQLAAGAAEAGLVRRGDASLVASDAAYRTRLRRELKRKGDKAAVLREDIERAKARVRQLRESIG